MRQIVLFGLLGPTLDGGQGAARWERWRPSVALCQHEELLVSRFELLYQPRYEKLMNAVRTDIRSVSPETEVRPHLLELPDAWDFEKVYATLHDFARAYPFDTSKNDYLVHITTGTHVAQICLFLLTETHYFPARLIQSSPPPRHKAGEPGSFAIIDLDLSKYDRLASRFRKESNEAASFLKSGIATRNAAFNRLIERIEQVATVSKAPMLLTGPTGAGKSKLARKIFELKKSRNLVKGDFVEVNSATLRGDAAMSALFGHVKGAFTGAVSDRPGLLRKADQGMLFLDEIGELGLDEQAMLLRAIEEKVFTPVGSDREQRSEFQLIAGTNRNLMDDVAEGKFREDLLARINLWTFELPGLRNRPEDIEPNLDFELEQFEKENGHRVILSREARTLFLKLATADRAAWLANFRDLNAMITRLATLAQGGRISPDAIEAEFERAFRDWYRAEVMQDEKSLADSNEPEKAASKKVMRAQSPEFEDELDNLEDGKRQYPNIFHVLRTLLSPYLGKEKENPVDYFDLITLHGVIKCCQESDSLSDAGRKLYQASRMHKARGNDADRLRKYLARFGLTFEQVQSGLPLTF